MRKQLGPFTFLWNSNNGIAITTGIYFQIGKRGIVIAYSEVII